MKTFQKIFATVGFIFFMAGMVQGSGIISGSDIEPATRTEISKEDLPQAVANSFDNGDYAQMEISKIYRVENEPINDESRQAVLYEIVVKEAGSKGKLAYSENGDLIKAGK